MNEYRHATRAPADAAGLFSVGPVPPDWEPLERVKKNPRIVRTSLLCLTGSDRPSRATQLLSGTLSSPGAMNGPMAMPTKVAYT